MSAAGILDDDGYLLVARYAGIRATITRLNEEKAKIRAELSALLDDADHGFYNGEQVITVTRCRPRRFDKDAFADDHPSLFEKYLKTAPADEIRFTVNKILPDLEESP